jgi:TrmH family RNA methyltransferase
VQDDADPRTTTRRTQPGGGREGSLIPRFGRARRDPALAVLEGFHPLKHAMRFGADIELLLTPDAAGLESLATSLAPELAGPMLELAQPVSREVFEQLAPLTPSTPAIAIALRPSIAASEVLASATGVGGPAPIVLLEDPRDLGNMGACVRAAAAADAAGVLTTGTHDPWHPDAIRGAAGLHFALAVCRLARLEEVSDCGRPLLAVDPGGEELDPARLDPRTVLAFGTERHGLSDELLGRADARVSIPMRPGVSSLNLATSVAALLFAWRLR